MSLAGRVDGDAAPSVRATFRRPPLTVLPASVGSRSTLCRSAALIWSTLACGNFDRYRAAAPLTNGAAIEVPLKEAYPLGSVSTGTVEVMSSPGAAEVDGLRAVVREVEQPVAAVGGRDRNDVRQVERGRDSRARMSALTPSLPAAATTSVPRSPARRIAPYSAWLKEGPPQLAFTMRAPCATAKSIAFAASAVLPSPFSSRNLSAITFTSQLTPGDAEGVVALTRR